MPQQDNTQTPNVIRSAIVDLLSGCVLVRSEEHTDALRALREYEKALHSECKSGAEMCDVFPRFRALQDLRCLIARLEGMDSLSANGHELNGVEASR